MEFAIAQPAWGPVRASNELANVGLHVSPSGVRSVWVRNDLGTMKLRLQAFSAKVAQDGLILTEAQVAALEKGKEEQEAYGEIEAEHPGYLGAGHVLRGHHQGRGAHLPADVHGHLQPRAVRQGVRPP